MFDLERRLVMKIGEYIAKTTVLFKQHLGYLGFKWIVKRIRFYEAITEGVWTITWEVIWGCVNNYLRSDTGRYLNWSKALYDCLIKPDPLNITPPPVITQAVVKTTQLFCSDIYIYIATCYIMLSSVIILLCCNKHHIVYSVLAKLSNLILPIDGDRDADHYSSSSSDESDDASVSQSGESQRSEPGDFNRRDSRHRSVRLGQQRETGRRGPTIERTRGPEYSSIRLRQRPGKDNYNLIHAFMQYLCCHGYSVGFQCRQPV